MLRLRLRLRVRAALAHVGQLGGGVEVRPR
jgi:hypothetical protein